MSAWVRRQWWDQPRLLAATKVGAALTPAALVLGWGGVRPAAAQCETPTVSGRRIQVNRNTAMGCSHKCGGMQALQIIEMEVGKAVVDFTVVPGASSSPPPLRPCMAAIRRVIPPAVMAFSPRLLYRVLQVLSCLRCGAQGGQGRQGAKGYDTRDSGTTIDGPLF